MSLTIDEKHRLLQDGKLVKRIMSPYTGGKLPKKPGITVIHFTYGASAASSANWFSDPTNTERTSAHVVVGRDGELIQCVDFDTVAHHAGRSFWRGGTGLNTWSFGVELANWGYLKEQGNAWVSWTGRVVPNAVLAAHRNGNPDNFQGNLGWEPYPAIQIRVAAEVVRTIADRYGIQELVGHDDISVGRKWDPGPAFDMARSRDLATGDDSDNGSGLLITWTPGDTLNLRAGPGVEFATDVALADGTTLEPLEFRGIWVLVNVLKDDMSATRTGWVNTRHTRTA